MQRVVSSPVLTNGTRWAVVIAVVAIGSLSIGRWVVPAGDDTTTLARGGTAVAGAVAEGGGLREFAIEPVEVADAAAPGLGHVVGMTFEPTTSDGAFEQVTFAAPESAAEGHVPGVRFAASTRDDDGLADPAAAATGLVPGVRFR